MNLEIVRWPDAREDILNIWFCIAVDNPKAAEKVISKIEHVIDLLRDNPLMGRARPEFGEDTRCFTMVEYVIFYRPAPNAIEIIRVLSAALDVDETFTV